MRRSGASAGHWTVLVVTVADSLSMTISRLSTKPICLLPKLCPCPKDGCQSPSAVACLRPPPPRSSKSALRELRNLNVSQQPSHHWSRLDRQWSDGGSWPMRLVQHIGNERAVRQAKCKLVTDWRRPTWVFRWEDIESRQASRVLVRKEGQKCVRWFDARIFARMPDCLLRLENEKC